MEWVITWGGEIEDVSGRTFGQASVEGLNAFSEEGLSDPRWRPGIRALVDHRELDFTALSAADLRARAELAVKQVERFRQAHLAVVVGRPVDWGVQRMMQAFADDFGADVALFYTLDEARNWLSQFPRPEGA